MSSVTSLSAQFTFILNELSSGDPGAIADTFDEITRDGDPKANY
jgi:hypothetical protein